MSYNYSDYDVIKKFKLINYNLNQYSLDTVKTFRKDALASKYEI